MTTQHSTNTFNFADFSPKTQEPTWKRILVPLDFSDSSSTALDYAVPMAMRCGGKLVLLHVVQFTPMPTPAVMGGGLGQIREAHKTLEEEAKVRLLEITKKIADLGVSVHEAVTVGVAWDEIVKAAKRLECDLIVISTSGHTGLLRILSGHTAEHVVRSSECPVLCIPG